MSMTPSQIAYRINGLLGDYFFSNKRDMESLEETVLEVMDWLDKLPRNSEHRTRVPMTFMKNMRQRALRRRRVLTPKAPNNPTRSEIEAADLEIAEIDLVSLGQVMTATGAVEASIKEDME